MTKCYSKDNERYYEELDSVVDEVLDMMDDPDVVVGKTFTIWEASEVPITVKRIGIRMASFMIEQMQEEAFEQSGDVSDGWPEMTAQQEAELDKDIAVFLDEWFTKRDLQPGFFGVDHPVERTVKITEVIPYTEEELKESMLNARAIKDVKWELVPIL